MYDLARDDNIINTKANNLWKEELSITSEWSYYETIDNIATKHINIMIPIKCWILTILLNISEENTVQNIIEVHILDISHVEELKYFNAY